MINSLKRSHACQFGSTPGLTRFLYYFGFFFQILIDFKTSFFLRHVQEVKIDKNLKLLDSPGIVISKEGDVASLVLKNCVRVSL